MPKGHNPGRFLKALGVLFAVASLGAGFCAPALAQGHVPSKLPSGPAKPGFDIRRFTPNGGIFKTFYVEKTESLRRVLQDGRVAEDTAVLVTHTAAGDLALLTEQMVFHHLAQGHAGGKDWLAAF